MSIPFCSILHFFLVRLNGSVLLLTISSTSSVQYCPLQAVVAVSILQFFIGIDLRHILFRAWNNRYLV